MSNLVNSQLKAAAEQAMKNVFDTFKRSTQVTAYKNLNQKTVLIEAGDQEYITGFKQFNQTKENFRETASESSSFDARIIWLEQPTKGFIQGDGNIEAKFKHNWGKFKITVEQDGYDFMKDCSRFYFNGVRYQLEDGFRQLGILDQLQYYQAIFKLID